ncbi:MAG: hypothetical protein ACXABO_19730 [Promethearchaeota archaeon]|jgi:N-formylglutamate amidohydrolase
MVNLIDYVEFQKGNIPLIFSVPHGGTLECKSIPKRIKGIMGVDGRTTEIARNVIDLIEVSANNQNLGDIIPSYIISKVRRSKIDLNRDGTEAYFQESTLAKKIYDFYHSKINQIILDNLQVYGRSLLIDIHGFEKDKRPSGFRDVELILGTNNLESFYNEPMPRKCWGNNFRGKLIRKFNELQIPLAPGTPKRREYVLTGGYITKKYGASQIPNSQTLQIEFSDRIRIYDGELRKIVLHALIEIIFEEMKEFLG